jgi:hypothetical protein
MRRLSLLLAVFVLGGIALTTAQAKTGKAKRTAICHRVNGAKGPYVKLSLTAKALKAHVKHAADIIPAPAGRCPATVLSATSGGTALTIALAGEGEDPAGDVVGTGTATVHLRAGQAQVCYSLSVENLSGAAVAAHIHKGGAGVSGPVVIPLATPAGGSAKGCVATTRALVRAILADTSSYYVNVHTGDFPGGAIRGQLEGTNPDSLGWSKTITLVGTSEPNAKGTAALRLRKDVGKVCYRLHVESVTLPAAAAHIHRGGAGVNGPVVVPFTAPDATGNSSGCADATAALIDEIIASPAGFYVNVHTKEHPAGAIRAQLG